MALPFDVDVPVDEACQYHVVFAGGAPPERVIDTLPQFEMVNVALGCAGAVALIELMLTVYALELHAPFTAVTLINPPA